MPVYVYHCTSCDKEFEVTQRMSDPPLTDCGCGAKGSVRRLLSSGAGVIFKGSGFYQTDYKGSAGAKSDPAGDSKPDSKSEPKTDPAPASGGGCSGGGCACAGH